MTKYATDFLAHGANYSVGKVTAGAPAVSFLINRNVIKGSAKKRL